MAVDALGPERVHCIMLPYRFTSSELLKDAEHCARALGVRYDILPIAPAVEGFEKVLAPIFKGRCPLARQRKISRAARAAPC